MRLIKTAATGLIALSSIALVACQKEASSPTPAATSASVYDTGKLRAVVIGKALPMVEKNGDNYDGLSFVVLDAIRDQINVSPLKKDKDVAIEPVAVSSPKEGLDKIRSGDADIACGVDFSWQRQRTLNYTLPFAMGGVRVLAPAGNDGTPESLNGKTVGVVKDTTASSVLASSVDDATFKFFDSPGDALAAIKDGSVEFLGGNTLWLKANQGRERSGFSSCADVAVRPVKHRLCGGRHHAEAAQHQQPGHRSPALLLHQRRHRSALSHQPMDRQGQHRWTDRRPDRQLLHDRAVHSR